MFNDLIGMPYCWGARPSDGSGHTDCFGLSMEVRARLGLNSFVLEFEWIYDKYEPETISAKQVLRWLWKKGEKLALPRSGAVFCSKALNGNAALATVIDEGYCLMIGPSKKVIMAPLATVARGRFYWAS